ncbi:mitochondrial dicarboxylate carrier isoform X1 [Heterocephalus glaber]|uniref:Mitochondrial dicarboxylate carrier n=1 Tax=Heterocephalus glaber TaxID=10181 RepID=A0AAX6RK40_HETGA|nr:mitochondrial dicarboxylate carrier isoform X1 [Heterocephalus glaber]
MAAEARVSRWYFGGLASCGAACCTHPLDLLKVHLQTQQEVKLRMTGMALQVLRTDGILALYNGLSASLCRQMTYSLTRFAIYETVRDRLTKGSQGPVPFYSKVLLGGISGLTGGFVGTPADLVNVRMQNDMKLPVNQRRNYAHALDGLYRVAREEGLRKLFSGATMASSRGALVTVGQLSCYDQAKQLVLNTGYLSDNIFTHFIASFIAGGCATFLCQPLDVLKTRLMNSKGEYQGHHTQLVPNKEGPSVPLRRSHFLCLFTLSPSGGFSLRRGDGQAGTTGLLQGPLSRWHSSDPTHCAHLCVPGAAAETLWHQGAHLRPPPG